MQAGSRSTHSYCPGGWAHQHAGALLFASSPRTGQPFGAQSSAASLCGALVAPDDFRQEPLFVPNDAMDFSCLQQQRQQGNNAVAGSCCVQAKESDRPRIHSTEEGSDTSVARQCIAAPTFQAGRLSSFGLKEVRSVSVMPLPMAIRSMLLFPCCSYQPIQGRLHTHALCFDAWTHSNHQTAHVRPAAPFSCCPTPSLRLKGTRRVVGAPCCCRCASVHMC